MQTPRLVLPLSCSSEEQGESQGAQQAVEVNATNLEESASDDSFHSAVDEHTEEYVEDYVEVNTMADNSDDDYV